MKTPPPLNVKKKEYNARYRLRKKGFTIRQKIIFCEAEKSDHKTVRMLVNEYHYSYQSTFKF